jgi:hypothetical protein
MNMRARDALKKESAQLRPLFALLAAFSSIGGSPALSVLGPYSTALNFSVDLMGTPDTRPATWGSAAAAQNVTHFHPPAGYRVRILRVYGDFIAWPKEGILAPGAYSEVGWGLKSTAPDGSTRVDNAYDNTFVWLQNAILPANPSVRASFDLTVKDGGLLEADNALVSQSFVAINTSGLVIHEEPTFTIIYQFEEAL